MFLFLVVALAVVVTATTLAVVGGGDRAVLPEAPPDRLHDPLHPSRALTTRDVEALRFPPALRGYRMADVDDALVRLAHELAVRDERIAALESALDTARADAARATLLASRDERGREERPEGTAPGDAKPADREDGGDRRGGDHHGGDHHDGDHHGWTGPGETR
ncbi:DivIVA domain-containing protein [Streptomyces sp. NPDC002640]